MQKKSKLNDGKVFVKVFIILMLALVIVTAGYFINQSLNKVYAVVDAGGGGGSHTHNWQKNIYHMAEVKRSRTCYQTGQYYKYCSGCKRLC